MSIIPIRVDSAATIADKDPRGRVVKHQREVEMAWSPRSADTTVSPVRGGRRAGMSRPRRPP